MRKIILTVVALLAIVLGVTTAQEEDTTAQYDIRLLQPGNDAPDFTITDSEHPDGFTLSSLKGNYVVLEFWASWCPDCRKETQTMVELYKKYSPLGVAFVGVSFDTDSAAWQRYVKSSGMEWTQYSELKKWKKETTIDGLYKVEWIPSFFLIDKEGKVAAASVSMEKLRTALENLSLDGGAGGTTDASAQTSASR